MSLTCTWPKMPIIFSSLHRETPNYPLGIPLQAQHGTFASKKGVCTIFFIIEQQNACTPMGSGLSKEEVGK